MKKIFLTLIFIICSIGLFGQSQFRTGITVGNTVDTVKIDKIEIDGDNLLKIYQGSTQRQWQGLLQTDDTATFSSTILERSAEIVNDTLDAYRVSATPTKSIAIMGKIVKKTIGLYGTGVFDAKFDTTADNHTAQNLNLGAIIPAKARVIALEIVCTDTLESSAGAVIYHLAVQHRGYPVLNAESLRWHYLADHK